MDRLDRKDLKDAAFDVVLRGYDKRQVDERLRLLGAELTAADNALRGANQRAAMLEDALSEARSIPAGEPSGDSNFGARVEKILKLAEDEAREVRSQADAAATALVEQARAQAAEQDSTLQRRWAELDTARQELDQAGEEVKRTRQELNRAGERILVEAGKVARLEANQLIAQARAEAEQLVAQASAHAQQLVAAATDAARQREQSSAHEVHQLSRLREEINSDLYRAKEVLDGLFGATGALLHKRRQDGAQPPHQARTV